MEIIVLILLMVSMVSIIVVSYGKQQEKYRRKQEWIRQVKKSKMEK